MSKVDYGERCSLFLSAMIAIHECNEPKTILINKYTNGKTKYQRGACTISDENTNRLIDL